MTGQDRPIPEGMPANAPDAADGAVESPVASDPVAHVRIPYSPEDFRNEINRVRRNRRLITVLCIVLAIVIVGILVSVVWLKVPSSLQTVGTDDMQPVLAKGQVVYVQEIGAPSDNDVVAYRGSDGATQVKRVVAIAGEWVNIASDGTAVVTTVPMEGSSATSVVGSDATVIASRQVPDNTCFVLADADADALEALYHSDSYVPYGQLLGKVTNRVWPITNIGSVS